MNRSPGAITWVGLAIVGIGGAALSFSSLDELALVCGTVWFLAPLLPVCIDAAAVVATRVWLRPGAPTRARRFARNLALTAFGMSVAGNGVSHYVSAYHLAPPWWAVVAVAAVPPAVLGAVAHLAAILVAGEPVDQHLPGDHQVPPGDLVVLVSELVKADPKIGRGRVADELNISENQARELLTKVRTNGHQLPPGGER